MSTGTAIPPEYVITEQRLFWVDHLHAVRWPSCIAAAHSDICLVRIYSRVGTQAVLLRLLLQTMSSVLKHLSIGRRVEDRISFFADRNFWVKIDTCASAPVYPQQGILINTTFVDPQAGRYMHLPTRRLDDYEIPAMTTVEICKITHCARKGQVECYGGQPDVLASGMNVGRLVLVGDLQVDSS